MVWHSRYKEAGAMPEQEHSRLWIGLYNGGCVSVMIWILIYYIVFG